MQGIGDQSAKAEAYKMSRDDRQSTSLLHEVCSIIRLVTSLVTVELPPANIIRDNDD